MNPDRGANRSSGGREEGAAAEEEEEKEDEEEAEEAAEDVEAACRGGRDLIRLKTEHTQSKRESREQRNERQSALYCCASALTLSEQSLPPCALNGCGSR